MTAMWEEKGSKPHNPPDRILSEGPAGYRRKNKRSGPREGKKRKVRLAPRTEPGGQKGGVLPGAKK